MKKITLLFCLVIVTLFARAQNGLECVEVEVYYISDANDSTGNETIPPVLMGTLPAGSVTYRVYANMLPGYKFQGVFGVDSIPIGGPESVGDHELRLETTTWFFNNEDRGSWQPSYTKTNARLNTVMLDSWFSVGAGCGGWYGIKKSLDDTAGTVINNMSLLQNADVGAGIPLTQRDGLIQTASAPLSVTLVGFTPQEQAMFENVTDTTARVLSTYNATWAALGGAQGPDTIDNRVLIGQFTTKGTFSFKLNIQIGGPNGVEKYVSENPVNAEILLNPNCLIFNSDSLWVGLEQQNTSNPEASLFSVYPNPTEDFVTLEMNNTTKQFLHGSLRIYDVTGKIILNKEIAADERLRRQRIDVSSLKSGLYFIEALIDGKASHQKFIKN